MDRTTIIKLRNFLVKLYGDPQTIRRVLDDADLEAARINLGGNATNIWHGVLDEAQKQAKIDQLLTIVLLDYPNRRTELEELLGDSGALPAGTPPPVTAAPTPATSAQTPQPDPPRVTPTPAPTAPGHLLPMELPRNVVLAAVEQQLLSLLLAKAAKLVVVTEFTDGRTPTRVLLVCPVAADGVRELPAVVKLGPRSLIEPEWQATQRQVLDRLPNFATVRGEPIYFEDETGKRWGALRYAQVGDGVFEIESLSRYASHANVQDLWQVLANRLFRQLGT